MSDHPIPSSSAKEPLTGAFHHDPDDPAESQVIARLAGNWQHRATVKKTDPQFLETDLSLPEYPDEFIPFSTQDAYLELPKSQQHTIRAWAFVSFNKSIADIEQNVVNPAFAALADDCFGIGLGDTAVIATTQAMVDEQYHTLMHRNASRATRIRRSATLPDNSLPLSRKAEEQNISLRSDDNARDANLTRVAFATVAEVSINTYLDLLAERDDVQPLNSATARIHSRDEYCHSSIAAELAEIVFHELDRDERQRFTFRLAEAVRGFTATDTRTWRMILDYVGISNADRVVDDAFATKPRQVTDLSGVRKLCQRLDIIDEIPIDWSTGQLLLGAE